MTAVKSDPRFEVGQRVTVSFLDARLRVGRITEDGVVLTLREWWKRYERPAQRLAHLERKRRRQRGKR